jgi:hypothetical protein
LEILADFSFELPSWRRSSYIFSFLMDEFGISFLLEGGQWPIPGPAGGQTVVPDSRGGPASDGFGLAAPGNNRDTTSRTVSAGSAEGETHESCDVAR